MNINGCLPLASLPESLPLFFLAPLLFILHPSTLLSDQELCPSRLRYSGNSTGESPALFHNQFLGKVLQISNQFLGKVLQIQHRFSNRTVTHRISIWVASHRFSNRKFIYRSSNRTDLLRSSKKEASISKIGTFLSQRCNFSLLDDSLMRRRASELLHSEEPLPLVEIQPSYPSTLARIAIQSFNGQNHLRNQTASSFWSFVQVESIERSFSFRHLKLHSILSKASEEQGCSLEMKGTQSDQPKIKLKSRKEMGANHSSSCPNLHSLPSSVHEFTVKDAKGRDVDLSMYKGKVLIIVNVASKCGFTNSNYTQLSELYTKYKSKGLEILAFPCNQFLRQEPLNDQEVENFACTRFKVEFPIFQKVCVNGPNTAPIYKFLKASSSTCGIMGGRIHWNFTKFLIDKEGRVIERFGTTTSPLAIEKDIQRALGEVGEV